MDAEKKYRDIAKSGAERLKKEDVSQASIVRKMKTLGKNISPAALANVLNGKQVGIKTLKIAANGVREIVKSELGLDYDETQKVFAPLPEGTWKKDIIVEVGLPASKKSSETLLCHRDGRLSHTYKVEFMQSAQREIIELGVKLSAFVGYFTQRRPKEYKEKVVERLKRGVCFHCYTLDPKCQEASIYFNDRARVQPDELGALQESLRNIEKLKRIAQEFKDAKLTGTFELYTYQHIPYLHILAVDPDTPNGKMMVSPYLYGVPRSEAPVWEFTQTEEPELFKTYLRTLKAIIKDAKPIS